MIGSDRSRQDPRDVCERTAAVGNVVQERVLRNTEILGIDVCREEGAFVVVTIRHVGLFRPRGAVADRRVYVDADDVRTKRVRVEAPGQALLLDSARKRGVSDFGIRAALPEAREWAGLFRLFAGFRIEMEGGRFGR